MLPVISVEALAALIGQPELVIFDATMLMPTPQGKVAYQPSEMIPGAKYFNFDTEICDKSASLPHMMPPADQFQAQVRELGVNQDSHIVVYDTLGLFSAARAWWMFRAMGHKKVQVLDGGLPAWKAAGSPTTDDMVTTLDSGNFVAKPQVGIFCDAAVVLEALNQEEVCVLDARGRERFLGQAAEPRPGMRSGHMPGAKNLPFASLLNADGTLKPIEQLRPLFEPQAGDAEKFIFSCGSGVTACILALVAELLGHHSLTVYDGSWSEWGSRQDLPVTQDEP
ncbi:sulfurtransferase [Corallincola platygyrae]|uniref:Sulfurtransferase n=1 Tax=Corallincola platygyrae TaxID=1193278 RepID=A0ABW4XQQ4_9GAMM